VKKLVLLAVLALFPSRVWAQVPAGAEFQANTYTTSGQLHPAVAADGSGNFVVVWESSGQDGSGFGIYGQRFSAAGVARGPEFRANSYTTLGQNTPAVASDGVGNFVVVWRSRDQDGNVYGIFGQRFDAFGAPRGAEFRVNSYTTGSQIAPAVASDPAGNFVVVWGGYGQQDGSIYGIFGQRFDASGAPAGSEFGVNSYTTGLQFVPAVAMDGGGNFVVVWQSVGQDGDGRGLFGQRFNAVGAPLGSEFAVNSYTTGSQYHQSVAATPSGDFVVVWQSTGQDGDASGIVGRRFSSTGAPLGSEFQVNSYTSGDQTQPAVAVDEQGNFVVAWVSPQDGSGSGIFGRRFASTGIATGADFQINTNTTGFQTAPALAQSPDGDFVVAWQTNFPDSSYDIHGQRYGDIIFEDGFESGDISRWSTSRSDPGDLTVSAAAAMAGSASGLQAVVNDTNSLYVEDDTPDAETRYRARLYFDPNGFDPGEASGHFRTRILIGLDPSGLRVVTLVLKRQGGAYSVEMRVRQNAGARIDTGFFPISAGPHFLEFDWQRAGSGLSNGALELRIDGVSVSTLSGIDNDLSSIGTVRMGAIAVKTGAAGTLFFDQFESRRQVLIGPEFTSRR